MYAIAQLTIHDRARNQRYAATFLPILTRYGGQLRAADERPEAAGGSRRQWHSDKVIVVAVPDRDAFMTWARPAEYEVIAKDRVAAANTVVLLVRGLA